MKPKRKSKGKKHALLFYRHTMKRLWRTAMLLDIVLWITWWFAGDRLSVWMKDFLWYGAVLVFAIALFSRLARNMSYAQAKVDHLLLATPFLRLKISYRRILSARPRDFVQLYPPKKMSWADKRFAQPYFGKTILAVILKGYPMPKAFLRLFFPKFIFLPHEKAGFVLVVPDWMALSTEIDSFHDSSRERKGPQRQDIGMRGLYGGDE